jgi:vancomycin resistance protein VanJ
MQSKAGKSFGAKASSIIVGAATICCVTGAILSIISHISLTVDSLNSLAPLLLLFGIVCAASGFATARRLLFLAGLMAALAAGERIVREGTLMLAPGRGLVVTIVTHNVRHDNRHPLATVAMLGRSGADILLLQETDGTVGRLLPSLAPAYPYSSRCPRHRCGLLILSRWPISRSRYRIRDERGAMIGPPLVWATIAPPGLPPFDVISIHLPWPLPAAVQADRRTGLVRTFDRLATDRLILAGDFNLTPWSVAMNDLDRGSAAG